jgi:hypothetical protein
MTALVIVAAVALLAGILQVIFSVANPASNRNIQAMTAAELESEYGLRVRLIGVTAAGGMVDVRFKVLDPLKAEKILRNPEMLPRLIAGKTVLQTTPPDLDSLVLEKDGIVFMLFPNSGGAVRPGAPVTIAFGDLHLEAIPAQ